MALTARSGHAEAPGNQLVAIPITAATVIYDGALVAIAAAGGLVNWTNTTGEDPFFMGVARITTAQGVSAAAGEAKTGNTALTIEAPVDISGVILKNVTVTGSSAANLGNLVYASDENTFTMTATGGADPIGWLSRFITTTTGDVKLFTPGEYRAHRAL